MAGPKHSVPFGTGPFRLQVGAQELAAFAYTSKPLLPIIEVVADSVTIAQDVITVTPTKGLASDVQTADQVVSNYPTPFLTNTQAVDQARFRLQVRFQDGVGATDAFAKSL